MRYPDEARIASAFVQNGCESVLKEPTAFFGVSPIPIKRHLE
jgi:hypothetical protein